MAGLLFAFGCIFLIARFSDVISADLLIGDLFFDYLDYRSVRVVAQFAFRIARRSWVWGNYFRFNERRVKSYFRAAARAIGYHSANSAA
jgi:hypothetical protein